MKTYKVVIVVFLAFLTIISNVIGQEWKVPDVKKLKTSHFKFTTETIKTGETIYKANCTSCHGIPGKRSFAVMTPSPGDPASEKFQNQTDGELFYKISNGRPPMPSFKNILNETERWSVISFFRSFNNKYVQPDTIPVKGLIDYIVELSVEKLADSNKIEVTAIAYTVDDPTPIIIVGADVSVFAERTFGLLTIGKKKSTNQNGQAIFTLPQDLPGDSGGNVNLVVNMVDEIGAFGEGETKLILKVGTPTFPENLLETRAMWSIRSKSPLWVVITYCGAVLVAFSFIFYILNQLLKMRKIGIKSNKS